MGEPINDKTLEELAFLIVKHIREEFRLKKMSGNLVNSITISRENGKIKIEIPAQTYNMKKYQTEGVLIHTSNGSYASRLDEKGSEFYIYDESGKRKKVEPRNHVGFLERCVRDAIAEWQSTSKVSVSSFKFM